MTTTSDRVDALEKKFESLERSLEALEKVLVRIIAEQKDHLEITKTIVGRLG